MDVLSKAGSIARRLIDKFLSLPSSPYTTVRDYFSTPQRFLFFFLSVLFFILMLAGNDYLHISHGTIAFWHLFIKWTMFVGLGQFASLLYLKWRYSKR